MHEPVAWWDLQGCCLDLLKAVERNASTASVSRWASENHGGESMIMICTQDAQLGSRGRVRKAKTSEDRI